MTVKTDDVTKGRKDLDPHGRFRGEWVKHPINKNSISLTSAIVLFLYAGVYCMTYGTRKNGS